MHFHLEDVHVVSMYRPLLGDVRQKELASPVDGDMALSLGDGWTLYSEDGIECRTFEWIDCRTFESASAGQQLR